jgi:hypothetical protein
VKVSSRWNKAVGHFAYSKNGPHHLCCGAWGPDLIRTRFQSGGPRGHQPFPNRFNGFHRSQPGKEFRMPADLHGCKGRDAGNALTGTPTKGGFPRNGINPPRSRLDSREMGDLCSSPLVVMWRL